MDPMEFKQQKDNQYVAVFMVVFGAAAMFVGCHFHYTELTTASGGIIGSGLTLLTNQIRASLNNRSGGTVNINSDPPPATA